MLMFKCFFVCCHDFLIFLDHLPLYRITRRIVSIFFGAIVLVEANLESVKREMLVEVNRRMNGVADFLILETKLF